MSIGNFSTYLGRLKFWYLPLLSIFQFQQSDAQLRRLLLQSIQGNQSANFEKECTETTYLFRGRQN